jgi:hypothetical protein
MLLAAALQPGHPHGSLGITVGPMLLRVLLLTAAVTVAAFATLRGFIGPPRHRTAVWMWSAAATVVVVELLLSDGLDIPPRAVPLVLAATGTPAYAIFSRDRRRAAARGTLRFAAPWACATAATLAAVEFTRAWTTTTAEQRTVLLHTGTQLAAVAVSWLVISNPRHRATALTLHTTTTALAMLVLTGAAHLTATGPEPPFAP